MNYSNIPRSSEDEEIYETGSSTCQRRVGFEYRNRTRPEPGFEIHALTFDYGQRIDVSWTPPDGSGSSRISNHIVIRIDLRAFGGSALTADIEVPKGRPAGSIASNPVTYVPARNTIFLSLALGWCETLGAADIVIGVNAIDYSGHPDCRPEFLQAFERLANVATRAGVEESLVTGFAASSHEWGRDHQSRERGRVDFSPTHSCYDPSPAGLLRRLRLMLSVGAGSRKPGFQIRRVTNESFRREPMAQIRVPDPVKLLWGVLTSFLASS